MTSFVEMLDRYGLSRDLFGVSAVVTPLAQDVSRTQVVQDATVPPDDDTENTVTSAPEHDPSLPPWGLDEDADQLAGLPDFNDGDDVEAIYPF